MVEGWTRWSKKEIEIIRDNPKKLTDLELSQLLQRSKNSIVYKRVSLNIQAIKGEKRIYKVNDNIFSKINKQSCYWAGFIAADGSINRKGRNQLTIELNNRDINHLQKFKKFAKFNGPIKNYTRYNSCKIAISSEKICKDLEKYFNIVSNKTLKLIPPNLTKKEHILAFIVGYIDGDGSILYYPKYKKPLFRLQLIGTEKVMRWCLTYTKQYFGIIGTEDKYLYNYGKMWYIRVSGETGKSITKKLNMLKVPKLRRKWDKCKTF